MGVILFQEPSLNNPDLVACWPGIGNIGLIAVDHLKRQIQAEELGEIEPSDFFYPSKVTIRESLIENLEFPTSKFYVKNLANKDLLIFIAEEQPATRDRVYAEGTKAYQMANLVLDIAQRFGCRRVYTSGAAVALTHYSLTPRVWAVASNQNLLKEMKNYPNVIRMGDAVSQGDRSSITGLNGLLSGLAYKRGFEAICLMGEIPDYLSGAPFPYPRASKSILEVLSDILGIVSDYSALDDMATQVDGVIDDLYDKLPSEIKDRIEQRKSILESQTAAITEDDEKWLKEHIDELFKHEGNQNEPPL